VLNCVRVSRRCIALTIAPGWIAVSPRNGWSMMKTKPRKPPPTAACAHRMVRRNEVCWIEPLTNSSIPIASATTHQ